MAKQLVNPVERHVEKAVAGLAGLLLIGTIAGYLVRSPNHLELGGASVTPGTIDQKVAEKAAAVRERIRQAEVRVDAPEPLYGVFERFLDPFAREKLSLSLPTAVPIGPEVPIIDAAGVVEGQAKLVEVVPVSEPAVTVGRSTFPFEADDGTLYEEAANWVTVSVVFKVKEQMMAQRREYGATRKEVVFGLPQLQRRQRRPDGGWSDEDWVDVRAWPSAAAPPPPEIVLVNQDGKMTVRREDRASIEEFFGRLREPALQLDLLRPMMHEIANGDEWTFPVITTYQDVLKQDDEYQFPNEPPAADPVDRYRKEEPGERAVVVTLTPQQRIAQAFKEFEKLMRSARDNVLPDDATRAYNVAFEIWQNKDASRSDKSKAQRLMQEAQQLGNDLRRRRRLGQGRPRRASGAQPDEQRPKRQPLPIQQLWVHDAQPGSVQSGVIYQYRIRPLIFNRLAGQPEKFRDPNHAATLFIAGDWSTPIEVAIPPDTEFYVTSQNERNREVGVEFYKWDSGVWVKSRRFSYEVGDALRGESRAPVPSEEDPGFFRAMIEFVADGTVVDIDFERTYRERRRGASRSGVKFAPPSTACCVVFADASGRLHERFVPTDKSHPNKRKAAARVWTPPKRE